MIARFTTSVIINANCMTKMFFTDDYDHPVNSVKYIKESIRGPGIDPSNFYSWFETTCSCTLDDICVDDKCKCIPSTGKNYIGSSLNLDILQSSSVYECGAYCSCNFITCPNRLVQKGPNRRLVVRLTEKKGYGLFTLDTILPGTFICEYAGELISCEVAKHRFTDQNNAKYILALREHYGQTIIETYIDAYKFANIGRYVNSSCAPNSTIVPTRTGCIIPRAAIFITKLVKKDEEITYFYGEGNKEELGLGPLCYCGSDNCVGFLPASLSAV